MTYNVFGWTLNLALSISMLKLYSAVSVAASPASEHRNVGEFHRFL